jgi:hypothetical protein
MHFGYLQSANEPFLTLNPRGHATQLTFPASLTRHIDLSKQGFNLSFLQTSLTRPTSTTWTQFRPSPVFPAGQEPQT